MQLFCGLGMQVSNDAFMQLINDAFGFTGTERDFRTLLPKLYRPGRSPQTQNYVVTEDGHLVAAVGAYSHDIKVCGITLPCRGIGNVAVAESARGKGYMKACMTAAMADMVKDGIVLSTLGGRRQRYRYFSYDKAGPCYTFVLYPDNIRHTYGANRTSSYQWRTVAPEETSLLADILALSSEGPFSPVRPAEDLYDIMTTWQATLWVATEGQTFQGYAVLEPDGTVTEIKVVHPEEFMPLLVALFDTRAGESLKIRLPAYQATYLDALAHVAEGVQVGASMSYTVLDYRKVIQAFFQLRATYDTLPDGCLTLLIHGFAGDEALRLEVKQGLPSVQAQSPGETCMYELSHEEALSLLFAVVSPIRRRFPLIPQAWFPLPLWMYRADEV